MLFTECPRLSPMSRKGCGCPTSESWCRKMTHLASQEIAWSGTRGTAHARSLGYVGGDLPLNIWIRSAKTGTTARFEILSRETRKGVLVYTDYVCRLQGVNAMVRIYND